MGFVEQDDGWETESDSESNSDSESDLGSKLNSDSDPSGEEEYDELDVDV